MRRVVPGIVLFAFGLACSGTLPMDVPVDEPLDEPLNDDDDDDDEAVERRVGDVVSDCSVDMVGVLVGVPGYGGEEAAEHVPVHKQPKSRSRHIADIDEQGMSSTRKEDRFCEGIFGDDACVGIPVALEHFGLPVYAEQDGWALVGLGKGGNLLVDGTCQRRAWVEVSEPLEVYDVTALLDSDMAYLRAGLTPALRVDPGGALLDDLPEASGEPISARVIRDRDVDGTIWVKVELYDQSPCDGKQQEVAEGWMPLHDDAGRLQLWFWSDC